MQFESITLLKHKFETIKNNILTIEQEKFKKIEELQLYNPINTKSQRPSSTSKLRPSSSFVQESVPNDHSQELESLKAEIRILKQENHQLKQDNQIQVLTIENLKYENAALKTSLDQFILKDKNNKQRPQSCLRSSSNSPKKSSRVTFAKELKSIKYFSLETENFCNGKTELELGNGENKEIALNKKAEKGEKVENEGKVRNKDEKNTIYQRSMRGFLDQTRAQMNKLNFQSFDSQISEYFRERSEKLASSMFKDN